MCPSLSPPGFFDFTAPHTSLLVWAWWLVPPLFILILVWGNRRFLRRLPDGPERQSIARLFSIGAGCWSIWVSFSVLDLLWGDAHQQWYASLSHACLASKRLTDLLGQMFYPWAALLLGANLLGLVGVFIMAFAFQRYQRARAAAQRIIL